MGMCPIGTDPIGIYPREMDTTGMGPIGMDPRGTEPVGMYPREMDPVGIDPVGMGAIGMGPAVMHPRETEIIGKGPTRTDPVRMHPTGMDPIGTDPVGLDPIGRAFAAGCSHEWGACGGTGGVYVGGLLGPLQDPSPRLQARQQLGGMLKPGHGGPHLPVRMLRLPPCCHTGPPSPATLPPWPHPALLPP